VALIPLTLIPVVVLWAPESLRYLQSKGRNSEALALLKKHGLTSADFDTKRPTDAPTRKYDIGKALKELWSASFRRRTAMLWISWAVLVYTYHGIFIWLPALYRNPPLSFSYVGSLQWVLIVTLAQVPGYYTGALLLDRFGRKPVAVLYLAMAGVGSLLLTLAMNNVSLILLWSVVISFFNLGAWSALYAYTPEMYPTNVRGTGSGAAASIGRLAGVIAPTATPLLYAYGGLSAAFAVFALVHLMGAVAILVLGVETKGKHLEEIAK
jgi:putative MFS transporter